jgi:cytochrome c-type biogenesis protein CcmE
MSGLDDELAKAVQESEAVAAAPPIEAPKGPEAPPPAPRRSSAKRSIGLLIALLIGGGAILTLVMTSFEKSMAYSKDVDTLLAERDRLVDRSVKVQGRLVNGTLRKRDEPCEYRFQVQNNGKKLDVVFPQCVVPDTFQDRPGMPLDVTAEGKLLASGQFEATHIMTKCPTKYEMEQRAAKGEEAPHAPFTPPPAAPPQATN